MLYIEIDDDDGNDIRDEDDQQGNSIITYF